MKKLSVKDVDVQGKRVLVRVGFDVPLDSDGCIVDDARMQDALPTVRYLVESGARVVLLTHVGRPDGVVVESLSTKQHAARFSELLGMPVLHLPYITGDQVSSAITAMDEGEVLLLENLRFDPREEANDPAFASELASYGDLYVSEAFSVAHRKHASIVGIPVYIPGVLGLAMEEELAYLQHVLAHPKRPLSIILGGVKMETRVPMIENFLNVVQAERVVIGGAMANTFFLAQGYSIGDSVCEEHLVPVARKLLETYGDRLVLPADVVVAPSVECTVDEVQTVHVSEIPDGLKTVDVGPDSVQVFSDAVRDAGTIIWNGPMGVFEKEIFFAGTRGVAEILASHTADTIIGGGDTASALRKAGVDDQMTFISTGGGAALMLFEGASLPAVDALRDVV